MIRIKICLLTSLFILFFASSSPAFYEYVDEHGVTRYTDDINDVPPDQRYGAEDVNLDEEESVNEAIPETGNATDEQPTTPASPEKKESNYDEAYEELNEKLKALAKERDAIKKEDEQLLQDKMKLKPGDDIDEYNEKAAALSQRTTELEEKKEAFNKKIDKLNSEIGDYNENVAKKLEAQLNEYEKIKRDSEKRKQ